eukprot:399328-Amphidinium_carterae.1
MTCRIAPWLGSVLVQRGVADRLSAGRTAAWLLPSLCLHLAIVRQPPHNTLCYISSSKQEAN